MYSIITNEWMDAENAKPIKNRPVLVRCAQGNLYVARWNGFYWVNHNTGSRCEQNGISQSHKITHFYMFEKFNENEII